MTSLEARYRWLLGCYPREHRARHEEEMIGVLLAEARPGQTRPHPTDAADLLWGALCVHTRRAFGAAARLAWRDGLALAAALWPFLALTSELATAILQASGSVRKLGLGYVAEHPKTIWLWLDLSVLAALPVLAVLLGRRLIAALGLVAFGLFHISYLSGSLPWILAEPPRLTWLGILARPHVGPVMLAGLAAIAVAVMPTTHRAIARVPRRAFLLWGLPALAAMTATKAIARWVDEATPEGLLTWEPMPGLVILHRDILAWGRLPWLAIVALAAGYACRSSVGRRAALLLFLPAAAVGDLSHPGDLSNVTAPTALSQIGCAALAFAAGIALTWSRTRNMRRLITER